VSPVVIELVLNNSTQCTAEDGMFSLQMGNSILGCLERCSNVWGAVTYRNRSFRFLGLLVATLAIHTDVLECLCEGLAFTVDGAEISFHWLYALVELVVFSVHFPL